MESDELNRRSVLIVDDHEMVAVALARILEASGTLRVAGVATTGDQAVRMAAFETPDVALVDVQLPERSGFEIAEEIIRRIGPLPIIFLSGMATDLQLYRALSFPCAGFLLKGEPISFLSDAIRRAADGQQVFSESVRERLEDDPLTGQLRCKRKLDLMSLTARQLDLLRHLASGLSVRDIAVRMHLSEKAVDSQKYRIMKRLSIHDRVELSRLAIREGLLEP